jgi:hypothetical protein
LEKSIFYKDRYDSLYNSDKIIRENIKVALEFKDEIIEIIKISESETDFISEAYKII